MADHGSSATHSYGFEEHQKTYDGFIKGSIALTILSLVVVVALVAFAFINTGNVLIGFAGIIISILTLIVDLKAGAGWKLSVGWLVIFGLITAVMVG